MSKSINLESLVSKYTNYHHLEMFFTNVLAFYIARSEEYSKGFFDSGDLKYRKFFYEEYRLLLAYILHEACKIKIKDFDEIGPISKLKFETTCTDLISYAELYFKCIPQQIYSSTVETDFILKELNDDDMFSVFSQKCFYQGYIQAIERIKNNIYNEEFYSIEYFTEGVNEQIKIFPTPKGMLMKRILLDMYNDSRKEFDKIFDNIFSKHNITRISNSNIEKKYNCTHLLVDNNTKKVYGYFPRKINNIYMEHGEQNRKNAMISLFNQSQINLTSFAKVK